MPFDNEKVVEEPPPVMVASVWYYAKPITPEQCACHACASRRPLRMPPPTGWSPGPALTPKARGALVEARSLIEAGWAQGTDSRPGTEGRWEYCLRGALLFADSWRLAHYAEAMAHLARFTPLVGGSDLFNSAEARVVSFNDHGTTTKADVLAVIDRALAA